MNLGIRKSLSKIISGFKLFLGKKTIETGETDNCPPGSDETPCQAPDTPSEAYLRLTMECMDKVQYAMGSPNPVWGDHDLCKDLANGLQRAVQCARFYLELFPGTTLRSTAESSSENHLALLKSALEVFKLLFASAKQVESFIHLSYCNQLNPSSLVAIILPNVWEHISSVNSDLHLCRTAFSEMSDWEATKSLSKEWLNGLEFQSEQRLRSSLLRRLNDLSFSDQEGHRLATFLSERLERSQIPAWDQPMIYEVDYKCLSQKTKLIRTSSCEVHKAMWLGAPVAMKTFTGSDHPVFRKEVRMLAGLSHRNVLSLLCTSIDDQRCVIITELLDEDLYSLIEKRARDHLMAPFSDLESVHMILQIAEGMLYLHRLKVIHRDLKSSNILVKHVMEEKESPVKIGYVHCKVSDFGLSKTKESSNLQSLQTTNVGTSRWMAPEVIKFMDDGARVAYDPFKADVYSFAMVCYEVLTGKVPFFTFSNMKQMKEKILLGEHPTWTTSLGLVQLKDLVEKCWSREARSRPSFDVICKELRLLKYSLAVRGKRKASLSGHCPVCLTGKKDVALDCGHQTCRQCANYLTGCPMCLQSR